MQCSAIVVTRCGLMFYYSEVEVQLKGVCVVGALLCSVSLCMTSTVRQKLPSGSDGGIYVPIGVTEN